MESYPSISNELKEFADQDRKITEESKLLSYRRRKDEEKKSIAYGQRKLLLTLVSFISEHVIPTVNQFENKRGIIVYAGAAPGVNIGLVADLFPGLEWHLYDPGKFKIATDLNKHFIIYKKKFDDDVAKFWAEENKRNKNVFFISDIRTADYTKIKNLEENEKQIMGDMDLQKRWVEIIKPVASQLKFRLPYTIENVPKEINYFDGILYLQPYSPQTSTETRLVLSDKLTYKMYDCEKYQSQLFYHNVIVREILKYKNEYADGIELIDDYDSAYEVFIWKQYLISRNQIIDVATIRRLSQNATKRLAKNRRNEDTLAYLRANPQAIKNRNFNKS